jgi:alkylhydroperoxidase/carboxymuconolactone decarboxylase family protein YurZ
MAEDALWYEAAFLVGVTNALNVVADGMDPHDGLGPLMEPVNELAATAEASAVFTQIRTFYDRSDVPLPFRILAHDPGYLTEFWTALQYIMSDNRLSRRLKEALAFAVSLTTRSTFGTRFHLNEMRRLGTSERGIMEILGVTQMFSSFTKIADTLQLEPDMGDIAPVDPTPPPAGPSTPR